MGMPIVSLTCQNRSCISKLKSEWKLYQLKHDLILLTIITEKVTIRRVMEIHNIMVLICIPCAVINHLFFTLLSELLLVTRSTDNHSPGPVMREVSP